MGVETLDKAGIADITAAKGLTIQVGKILEEHAKKGGGAGIPDPPVPYEFKIRVVGDAGESTFRMKSDGSEIKMIVGNTLMEITDKGVDVRKPLYGD